MSRTLSSLTLCATLALTCPALAQESEPATPEEAPAPEPMQTLPMGVTAKGTTSSTAAAVYHYTSETAGVLTVAVRAEGDADLMLLVTDEDGQTLPNGRADADLEGGVGAEQIAVTLPGAGTYSVRVVVRGFDAASFLLGASWIPVPSLAKEPDPDGRPSTAQVLEINSSLKDTITPSQGDRWDWFAVQLEKGGTLTVVTKAPEGDLVLELYAEGVYYEPQDSSDQDMGEIKGNESVTVQAEAASTYYFRVLSLHSVVDAISYEIKVGLIAD